MKCKVDDCEREILCRELCPMHYQRWQRNGTPHRERRWVVEEAVTRFWSKVMKEKRLDGCWHWMGGKDPKGYGRFWDDGKTHVAHRFSYFLVHGRFPNGMGLHSCDNPSCVRPDHIRQGTAKENSMDMVLRGRSTKGRSFQKENE